jgi:hypothetical protein
LGTAGAALAGQVTGGAPAGRSQRDSLGRPLGALAERIVAVNATAEDQLGLVARVAVQPNEIVEFYEPRPGHLFMSDAGAIGSRSRLDEAQLRGRSPEEVWAAVSGGRPMPASLAAAVERRQQAVSLRAPHGLSATAPAHGGGSPAAPQPGAPVLLAANWCDTGYFSSPLSNCPNADVSFCLDNWHNGFWAQVSGMSLVDTNVCAADGAVVFKVTEDDSIRVWTVAEGTDRHVWCSDCDLRVDVTHASGDRFHVRFLAWE